MTIVSLTMMIVSLTMVIVSPAMVIVSPAMMIVSRVMIVLSCATVIASRSIIGESVTTADFLSGFKRRIRDTQIARDRNAKYNADKIGYVTCFALRKEFSDKYETKIVGGITHEEYWIPAEDLEELNRNIAGRIEVITEFRGE